ncbi:efflux RND transporter periplasmic adaptor subunit [Parafilimonas sp.]|uniref:efflux RND transporter periplasmic adaptor subunit n=1 Tax=Parafilimonas sp. TaxID=1969739 RepID=UPI0039E620DF
MRNKSLYTIMLSATAGMLLQSCGSSLPENKFLKDSTVIAATEVSIVKKGRLASTVDIPGELQPFQQVDLYAKVNSYVKQLYVDVGSEVKQGQLLATMDAPEINSQLSAAQSRLKSFEAIYIASKANYDRLLETSKTPGTISPNDLDIALSKQNSDKAQYDAAKAAYNEVVNNKDYLQIRAPFTGVITARNVSQGAYVGPSGKGSDLPMFTLQTRQKLRLVVYVPEAYTGYVEHHSEISFTVQSLPGEKFTAHVTRLAGALDEKLRSERVEMDVLNNDKKLLPGMVTNIHIPLTANDSTLIVPSGAIVNTTQSVHIVKVENGKAVWVNVQQGREAGDETEVYGNLKAGDTILTTATDEAREDMPIGNTKVSGSPNK